MKKGQKMSKARRLALSRKMKARHAAARGEVLALPAPDVSETVLNAQGYEALALELVTAFEQSASGKGRDRHANSRPFDRQPILELGRLYGPGFAAGQAAKKTQEALGMLSRGEREKALFEVHGAIVYLSALASLIREG